ncbi:MAG: serine O-acetyltransferase [Lachnospiraceae bacterium]|nr:serine O-acetyltransferase [Lachnospiraceae bacterium]
MSDNTRVKEAIDKATKRLNDNYKSQGIFEKEIGENLPKKADIIDTLAEIQRVIFPGFFGKENSAYVKLDNFAGSAIAVIYERLFKEIRSTLLYRGDKKRGADFDQEVEELTLKFIDKLPDIQELILKDVEAELEGDPAASSKEEIIFSYPGIYAIFVYRVAHELYNLKIPYIPRIMTEYAHGKTGIDINPGANIGEYFFIDHGTGIVIGETTTIGKHVKIYQGVTLGALSTMKGQQLSGTKRHPTIEDNVVIYANATVLGGDTVIGKNSVIAGNTFITESVPENTRVSALMPELKIKSRK